jgi:subtilase family serine protease
MPQSKRASLTSSPGPRGRCRRLLLEELEPRTTPSVALMHPFAQAQPLAGPYAGAPPFYPADISGAYQFSKITFNNPATHTTVPGDGRGQTIAIVDAGDSPTLASDLATFDAKFNLPAPPNFVKVNWAGQTAPLPPPVEDWAVEISLDVEWAHAMAPAANIVLFEAATPTIGNVDDLGTAVQSAANPATYRALGLPVAGVISNSYGGSEFSSEASLDYLYTTSDNHATFVVSTGDSAAPGEWPAYSPDVLAAGGTSLFTKSSSSGATIYGHETGWSSGGGGVSVYEPKPFYQSKLSYGMRSNPDVSMDADPNTGVYVVIAGQAFEVGGTSVSAPLWSALLADLNEGRAFRGEGPLANAQALVYQLPKSDFHDITVGNNGFAAGPGYDLVTGIGSPYANLVVNSLLGAKSATFPGTSQASAQSQPTNLTALAASPALRERLIPKPSIVGSSTTPSSTTAQPLAALTTVTMAAPLPVQPHTQAGGTGFQVSPGSSADDTALTVAASPQATDSRQLLNLASAPDQSPWIEAGWIPAALVEPGPVLDGTSAPPAEDIPQTQELRFAIPARLVTVSGVVMIAAVTWKADQKDRRVRLPALATRRDRSHQAD